MDGRVWSCRTRKYLKPWIDRDGYHRVRLGDANHQGMHRLVANKYIPNPESKPFVNHINGIKSDNHVSNLEWVTQSENELHAYKTGLKNTGHLSKLSPQDVTKILGSSEKGSVLAKKYGVTPTRIWQIRNGKETKEHS